MELTDKTSYTRHDYAALPEGAPYQLIEGQLVMSPAPTSHHQRILLKLAIKLTAFVEDGPLGEVFVAPIDVYLSEENALQPDLIYISEDRKHIIEQNIEGTPDLVMEILSPATASNDLNQKKDIYEKAGVREYWIVHPEQKSIAIHLLEANRFKLHGRFADRDIATSVVLKGFSIPLNKLFATNRR